jgi:hypothetical protein
VGVYASVANFEDWIKRRVPAAAFYASAASINPSPGPAERRPAGLMTSGPPLSPLQESLPPLGSPAQIVAAAFGSLVPTGSSVSLAGFGLVRPQPIQGQHAGPSSNQLLEIGIPVVDRANCVQILSRHYGAAISRVIDAAM